MHEETSRDRGREARVSACFIKTCARTRPQDHHVTMATPTISAHEANAPGLAETVGEAEESN